MAIYELIDSITETSDLGTRTQLVVIGHQFCQPGRVVGTDDFKVLEGLAWSPWSRVITLTHVTSTLINHPSNDPTFCSRVIV